VRVRTDVVYIDRKRDDRNFGGKGKRSLDDRSASNRAADTINTATDPKQIYGAGKFDNVTTT